MAKVNIKFSVQFKNKAMFLFDETGKYKFPDNKNGWGKATIDYSEVTQSLINIFLPESETPKSVDVTGKIPSATVDGVEITPSQIGLEKFPSGVYRIDYIVYSEKDGQAGTTYKTEIFLNIEDIKCCIEKSKLEVDLTDVKSEKAQKVIEAQALLENAIFAYEHCRYSDVNKIVKYLELQCKCKCC
jgi:hypothetical protein